MPKLTDTQLVILNAAAGRETHAVLPLPESLKVNKGTATSVLKAMVAKGLVEEISTTLGAEAWRQNDSGHRFGLTLTEIGIAALESGTAAAATKNKSKAPGKTKRPEKLPLNKQSKPTAQTEGARPSGKLASILALVSRPEGAGISELQKTTGWQPHSLRAALTGLRKRGITIDRNRTDAGETSYRAQRA